MSSASIPAPRSAPPSSSRINYFWPILIYLLGAGTLAFYQVQALEDQLSEVTTACDRLDPKVKMAEYQKAKFYAMARDLLRLAPTHPGAAQIVEKTGLRNLQKAQPELMSFNYPVGFTNTAPANAAKPIQVPSGATGTTGATNAAPLIEP